ncbi:hypothetical protein CA13_02870 [Planctomycetes bacterium CA13]|uniref:Uncharacterized protein n=1 Tax=Novipirellula herctigrandis TaxID=2527986 RepID=A0A5C5YVM4_9BACT|nr:hypothetical protein CA13_02870 [Planctomycetes bacterium CA13]
MTLQRIEIPDSITRIPISDRANKLIDEANERIEAFMLADQSVIEDFVTCDFDLLDQSLGWIQEHHLPKGGRFCELGSGFGVAGLLATIRGIESVGIEIESALVEQAQRLADDMGLAAKFYCGSFVPRDAVGALDLAPKFKPIDRHGCDVYEEMGLSMQKFDLFFAFPWPNQHSFFEAFFKNGAADGSLLLTYRGREGMNLVRKI